MNYYKKAKIFKFQIQGGRGYVLFCLGVLELFEDLRKELSIIIDGAYSN